MKFFESNDLYFFWKSQGVPSTYGKDISFLDNFDTILQDMDKVDNVVQTVQKQSKEFGKEMEYGLLNRLDNNTGGLLYFAKSQEAYTEYKNIQKNGKARKIYIADVHGKVKFDKTIVCYPIMHHKHLDNKMVAIKSFEYIKKGRGKQNFAETYVENLYYDEDKNISTLMVQITRGVRHQIRVHLSSIGCPIIGDNLYSKAKSKEKLHLRSIGLQIN